MESLRFSPFARFAPPRFTVLLKLFSLAVLASKAFGTPFEAHLSDGEELRPWNGELVELRASTENEALLIETDGDGFALTVSAPATEDLLMGTLLLIGEETFALQSGENAANLYAGGPIDQIEEWILETTIPLNPNGSATIAVPGSIDAGRSIFLFGPASAGATLHSVDAFADESLGDANDSGQGSSGGEASSRVSIVSGLPLPSGAAAPTSDGQTAVASPQRLQAAKQLAQQVARARTRNLTVFNATH